MASINFQVFDRNLRRLHMLSLVDNLDETRAKRFRASLVVNPHTGLPVEVADDKPAVASTELARQ